MIAQNRHGLDTLGRYAPSGLPDAGEWLRQYRAGEFGDLVEIGYFPRRASRPPGNRVLPRRWCLAAGADKTVKRSLRASIAAGATGSGGSTVLASVVTGVMGGGGSGGVTQPAASNNKRTREQRACDRNWRSGGHDAIGAAAAVGEAGVSEADVAGLGVAGFSRLAAIALKRS